MKKAKRFVWIEVLKCMLAEDSIPVISVALQGVAEIEQPVWPGCACSPKGIPEEVRVDES